jgi:hypothetical protein
VLIHNRARLQTRPALFLESYMEAWKQVKQINEKANRFGEAGVTQKPDPDPNVVQVKWDKDGVIEAAQLADLQVLGG